MEYYRNTLNCYRLPAANANAMKLQAPDKRRLTKYRDLSISSQNTALSDLCALLTLLPRGLWFCVSLQCGHAIRNKIKCLKHTRQPM